MNNNENLKLDDLLNLKETILSISKESAAQEERRSEVILKKSDFLMKYISAIFVIINAVCIFAITHTSIKPIFVFVYYIATGLCLLISMFFTINAQTLVQAKFFPTGQDILKTIQHNSKDPSNPTYTFQKSKVDAIKYYGKYTDSLQKTNDKRAKSLKRAYSCFFVGIFCVTIGSFIMIVLIA